MAPVAQKSPAATNRAPAAAAALPMVPPPEPITDDNILRALKENWDPEHPNAFLPLPKSTAYNTFITSLLRDPRDLDIITYSIFISFTVVPSALFLIFGHFTYVHAILHLAFTIPKIEQYVHALHNASHRPIFKKEYRILDLWIPYVLGPWFGQTWNTYYFHHVKMHHVADNGPDDASSTLTYQRDTLVGWLHYFLKFYFYSWHEVGGYFWVRKQYAAIALIAFGEYFAMSVILAVWFLMPQYSLGITFTLMIPFNLVRLGMMQGNWVQHAFLDRSDPAGGGRKNSISCIQTDYNPRSFNDGYHASHHLNPIRHWLDHPRMLLAQRLKYEEEQAVVFEGLDYPQVWVKLMMKDYKGLAKKWVHMGYGPRPSDEEIVKMLKIKTAKFSDAEIEKIYGKTA